MHSVRPSVFSEKGKSVQGLRLPYSLADVRRLAPLSVAEVSDWVKLGLQLPQYAEAFKNASIQGAAQLNLCSLVQMRRQLA